jgi:hypothetical protein
MHQFNDAPSSKAFREFLGQLSNSLLVRKNHAQKSSFVATFLSGYHLTDEIMPRDLPNFSWNHFS